MLSSFQQFDKNLFHKHFNFSFQVYEYYLTPPEPEERIHTMETLQMSARSTSTMDTSDVYEAYVKPKDVKNKWIQTEKIEEGKRSNLESNCIPKIIKHTCLIKLPIFKSLIVTCSCMVQPSPTNQELYGRTMVENENFADNNGEILSSEASNDGQPEVAGGFLQTDERALVASDVYTGLC